MSLPKELTTVTTFSKLLALFIFAIFSLSSFFAGMAYQKINDEISLSTITPTPTPFVQTSNWKTYIPFNNLFSIQYPTDWIINKNYSGNAPRYGNIPLGSIGPMVSEGEAIQFQIAYKKPSVSLEEFSKPGYDCKPDCSEIYSDSSEIKTITIDNKTALWRHWTTGPSGELIEIYIPFSKTAVLIINTFGANYQSERIDAKNKSLFDQVLSTFKFLPASPSQGGDATPSPTCTPRPACLDSEPRCLMPETEDMCPPSPKPTDGQIGCTLEAKLCPNGSSVGRTGPNCEFATCPK